VVGSGALCHATRDSRMDSAPSYCSKGYPCFRVPTVTCSQKLRIKNKATRLLMVGFLCEKVMGEVLICLLFRPRTTKIRYKPTLSLN
jgi:hypothetical protein